MSTATTDPQQFPVRVDPAVFTDYPDYEVLIVYARNLTNTVSDANSAAALRSAEAAARETLAGAKPSTHPHIAAWRAAFGRFGAKPSKFPCSAEALLNRVARGDELPAINALVDRYNAVSVQHILPAGGEDLDALVGTLWLRAARGDEPFDVLGGDAPADADAALDFPPAGEMVWADDAGVTCRRWNWRQGRRTQLREDSRNAYFILDRLSPLPSETLLAAGIDLIAHIRAVSPDAAITALLCHAAQPEGRTID